ncbi:staphopain B [Enterococcus sp. DIV0724b]|uniref:C47 family peptidase n=1 Tax=Enterococcus sp. DIV0724b TaxID=2774694 RepID=UPI003D2FBE37
MNQYKKIGISLALSFSFMVGFSSQQSEAAELFVKSEEIPSDITETAKLKWEGYLQNMLYLEGSNLGDYYLGQPFTISYSEGLTYNFPIVKNENKEIKYVLQVNKDDQQTDQSIILTQAIAKQLEKISTELNTTNNQSISLKGNVQNVYYEFKEIEKPLILVDDDVKKVEDTNTEENEISKDITQPLATPRKKLLRSAVEFEHNILPWKAYELQTTQPWCHYFSVAAIINYQAGKQITSASNLIHGTYPNATEAQLMDVKWIVNESKYMNVINYTNKKYNMAIKYDPTKVPFSKVKSEISANAPLAAVLRDYEGKTDGHSINVIGYTAPKNGDTKTYPPYYYYWNPWWEEIFVVSSSSDYMTLGQTKYKWNETEYNYRYK